MLRYRVHGALDEESYTRVGGILALRIRDVLQDAGLNPNAITLLDFACGPGRVAAELKALVPECAIFGCDVDNEAIQWAHRNLSSIGIFAVNEGTPPTSFESGFFDAIYSISLFTHLNEEPQNRWLEELRRLVRQGGIVIATVHGTRALASCTREELNKLQSTGFLYRVGSVGCFKLDGLPDDYQTTFHSREYVERVWGKWFAVETYIEGGLDGHQDLVVLRKHRESPQDPVGLEPSPV
jgi:SAM-dependent methyltransferase